MYNDTSVECIDAHPVSIVLPHYCRNAILHCGFGCATTHHRFRCRANTKHYCKKYLERRPRPAYTTHARTSRHTSAMRRADIVFRKWYRNNHAMHESGQVGISLRKSTYFEYWPMHTYFPRIRDSVICCHDRSKYIYLFICIQCALCWKQDRVPLASTHPLRIECGIDTWNAVEIPVSDYIWQWASASHVRWAAMEFDNQTWIYSQLEYFGIKALFAANTTYNLNPSFAFECDKLDANSCQPIRQSKCKKRFGISTVWDVGTLINSLSRKPLRHISQSPHPSWRELGFHVKTNQAMILQSGPICEYFRNYPGGEMNKRNMHRPCKGTIDRLDFQVLMN